MSGLQLRHDVLDAQLVDRHGQKIGRCDTVILELRDGQPPRVTELLIGGPVRDERLGRWASAIARLMRAIGGVHRSGVSRIPFAAVRALDDTIELDVLRDNLESEHVERWLAEHIIGRIPGSQGERK